QLGQGNSRLGLDKICHLPGVGPQPVLIPGRKDNQVWPWRLGSGGWSLVLFDDEMGIGPTEPERTDRRSPYSGLSPPPSQRGVYIKRTVLKIDMAVGLLKV